LAVTDRDRTKPASFSIIKQTNLMSYFFDSALSKDRDCFLCAYSNSTRKTQVVSITNLPNLHLDLRLEKVVFAGDRLLFLGVPQAILEVHTQEGKSSRTHIGNTTILKEAIPCQDLRVLDNVGSIFAEIF
jgi:hypothetical protein